MKRPAERLIFAVLLLMLAGCAAPRLSTVAVEEATPQEGWEGIDGRRQAHQHDEKGD